MAAALAMAACEQGDDGRWRDIEQPLAVDSYLTFASICPGERQTMMLRVANVGTTRSFRLLDARIENDDGDFSVAFTPVELTPDRFVDLPVTYAPRTTERTKTAYLVLEHDIEELGFLRKVPLTVSLDMPMEVHFDPNPIDFGEVEVGRSKDLDFTVTNMACDPVTIQAIRVAAPGTPVFSLVSVAGAAGAGLPAVLVHEQSVNVTLRFTPDACAPMADISLEIDGAIQGAPREWGVAMEGEGSGPSCSAD
jgi:hypothetical protein